MMDDYRNLARIQYDELRMALQRAEENQVATSDLIRQIERLLDEHHRLVEQLLAQDEDHLDPPLLPPTSELDT